MLPIKPFSIICILLFVGHQILQKSLGVNLVFIDSYLDDFLCLPIILSLLFLQKKYLFRVANPTLSGIEIVATTLLFSLISEFLFPYLSTAFTYDPWDFVAFGLGGLVSFFLGDGR